MTGDCASAFPPEPLNVLSDQNDNFECPKIEVTVAAEKVYGQNSVGYQWSSLGEFSGMATSGSTTLTVSKGKNRERHVANHLVQDGPEAFGESFNIYKSKHDYVGGKGTLDVKIHFAGYTCHYHGVYTLGGT